MNIIIQIRKNKLIISEKKNVKTENKNIFNTNALNNKELIFSVDYIKHNKKIIISFIKEILEVEQIQNVRINKTTILEEILNILKSTTLIHTLEFQDGITLTFKESEIITKFKAIENISVDYLPDFMLEYLDKYGVYAEVRNEIFFQSEFMNLNNLKKYSSIFYKRDLIITFPFSETDLNDFSSFCAINKYLHIIHVNKTIKSDLETIIDILKIYNKKNIKIIIHENINDLELINYIKYINKLHKKTKRIIISVSYSNAYLRKNILPQTNLNILKIIMMMIFISVCATFAFVGTRNYIDFQKDLELKSEIREYIDNTTTPEVVEKLEIETKKEVTNDYIASLMTYNEDIIGWLKVNDTEVDYPILQSDDNEYYIKYNIKHEYDYKGSIFLNYVNNSNFEDSNSILFGHTIQNSSVMFGTLRNIEEETWRKKEENLIISIDTAFETLEYKIFSYYTINITTDYLQTKFPNELDQYEFFSTMQKRSQYDFDVTLKHSDRILTLSTCESGGYKRLVVHAVLL